MQTSEYIANWLTLGPIFNPAHQADRHTSDDGHPTAAEIIRVIDRESIDPVRLTVSLAAAPSAGDTLGYGDGSHFPTRDYRWQPLGFGDLDGSDPRTVQDAIHTRLGAGRLSQDPADPASFAGKHHALVFLLTYVFSPDGRSAQLCVRSDDAIRVWFNGAEVLPLRHAGDRDINQASRESCTEASLRQGVNILLAAVAVTHYEWGFSARFEPSQGLRYLTSKPDLMTVRGQVADALGQPLAGARVSAFDKDLRREQLLGEQTTEADGRYQIQYIRDQFRRAAKASADLIVRVLDADGALLIASPVQFNAPAQTTLDLMVGGGAPRKPSELDQILETLAPVLDGVEPAELGAEDVAFLVGETALPARNLGLLAQAHRLAAEADLPPAACYALLRQGLPTSLPPLLGHAPAAWRKAMETAIDENIIPLALRAQLDSVIERLTRLAAETAGEPVGMTPIRLRLERLDDSVSALLATTGADRDYVNETLNAHLRSQLAAVLADYDHDALAAFVQAMPSVDLAAEAETDLRAFMTKQAEAATAAGAAMADPLRRSIDTLSETTTIAALLELDQPLKRHRMFAAEANRLRLRGLLDTSPGLADRALQQRFLDRYAAHEGDIETFWQELRADPDFESEGLVDGIQHTLQLSHLTGHNIPLVAALQRPDEAGQVRSLRDLVRLSAEDWRTLIRGESGDEQPVPIPDGIPGDDEESRLTNYVATIRTGLEAAFPTDFVAMSMAEPLALDRELILKIKNFYPDWQVTDPLPRDFDFEGFGGCDAVEQALQAWRTEALLYPDADIDHLAQSDDTATNPQREVLGRFFANSPDFDIERQPAAVYLADHKDKAFDGIDEPQRAAVTRQLGRLQRLFRVTPRAQQIRALLAEGLDSASAITGLPYQVFAKRMAMKLGGKEQVELVYRNALQIAAVTQHTFVQAHQLQYDVLPFVMGGGHPEWRGQVDNAIDASPTLKTLFGSMDLCACEHCRSIYSPAAYFVEILQFLDTGRLSICGFKSRNPLEVLLDRRPDLAHIRLNCENAMTPMPYVDLVNEVLEYLVVHERLSAGAANQTGAVPAEALKANPQHVITAAYETLKGAHYPISLPFDLDIETVRVYLEHLGSSRLELMELFLPDEPQALKQRQLDAERLALTPVDYEILTGTTIAEPDPLGFTIDEPAAFGYLEPEVTLTIAGVSVTHDWQQWLIEARRFLERTGLSYPELVALLGTRVANLDPALEPAIVLRGEAACDLDQIRLAHADGSSVPSTKLVRLNRIIRLWRKLGWSLAEFDSAAQVFGPVFRDDPPTAIRRTFLHQLARVLELHDRLRLPIDNLLVLWGDIETFGDNSLYRRLFLNRAALAIDAAFEPINGQYLPEPEDPEALGQRIWPDDSETVTDPGHISTLLAAFRIREADLELIAGDAAQDFAPPATDAAAVKASALLTLRNVSLIYRYVILAKCLGWSIADCIALRKLSGHAPFADPDRTAAFVDLAEQVERSGFSMQQLVYLYGDPAPEPSLLAPKDEQVAQLAATLHKGLAEIAADNAEVPNPDPETTRTLLASVFEQEIADRAVDIVLETAAIRRVPLSKVPISLDPPRERLSFPDPRVWHDAATGQLCCGGPLSEDQRDALIQTSAQGNYDPQERQDFDAAVQTLLEDSSAFLEQAEDFFTDALSGLLEDTSGAQSELSELLSTELLSNPWAETDGKLDEEALVSKLGWLLKHLLPYRRKRQTRGFIIETLSAALAIDADLVAKLLDELPPLPFLDGTGDDEPTPMDDIKAIRTSGLTASPFAASNPGEPICHGTALSEGTVEFMDYGHPDAGHAPELPDGTACARWEARLLAPSPDTLRFRIAGNTAVNLWIDDHQLLDTTEHDIGAESAGFQVQAGHAYRLRIEAPVVNGVDTELRVYWQGKLARREILGGEAFLPNQLYSAFHMAYQRLHKAALLISTLALTAEELDYLTGDAFKASITTNQGGENPTAFDAWCRLVHYVALRDGLPPSDTRLTDVLATASDLQGTLGTDEEPSALLTQVRALTGWAEELVPVDWLTSSAPRRLDTAGLKDDRLLARLMPCATLARRFGLTTATLTDWASTASAQQVKDSMRAKYDEETWPDVAKPLNDKLRDRCRDALLAYLLAQSNLRDQGIDSPNRLYAHLLIDVEMDPCMMTSRIKQAIASVQLFVQRCLMNLEANVAPDDLDSEQWEGRLKWYRVAEAARKVLLYPENWIEPELRDDKSPFFKELESELLQGDLTPQYIESVFLNYLKKLDQVARLQICAIYWEGESDGRDTGDAILHVFGRTSSPPYAYFYRKWYQETWSWSPWESLNVSIHTPPEETGIHLIPAVHNRRLYLFWPIFTEKPDQDANQESGGKTHSHWDIQLAWTELWNGRWMPKKISADTILSRAYEKQGQPGEIITRYLPIPSQHLFRSVRMNGQLSIEVYTAYEGVAPCYAVTTENTLVEIPNCKLKVALGLEAVGQFVVQGCKAERPQIIAEASGNYSFEWIDNAIQRWQLDSINHFMAYESKPQAIDFALKSPYDKSKTPVLGCIADSFRRVTFPHQRPMPIAADSKFYPFFYEDYSNTFFVRPTLEQQPLTEPDDKTELPPYFDHPLPKEPWPDLEDNIEPPPYNWLENPHWDFAYDAFAQPIISAQAVFAELAAPVPRSEGKIDSGLTAISGGEPRTAIRSLTEPNAPSVDRMATDIASKASAYSFMATTVEGLIFERHYHSHVCDLVRDLNAGGVSKMLGTANRLAARGIWQINLLSEYLPADIVVPPYPYDSMDLSHVGAYAIYNWELVFHIPLLIATRLMQDQRFAEAREWFHHIFDPTDGKAPSNPQKPWSRYWKTAPFRDTEPKRLRSALEALIYSGNDRKTLALRSEIENQIAQWRKDPFKPHSLARLRLMAYQKSVVMKYIDNLLEWGDRLFRQDTIESINEATQLYVLAQDILGERPQLLPKGGDVGEQTYAQLRHRLDELGNALMPLEDEVAASGTDLASWARLRWTPTVKPHGASTTLTASEGVAVDSAEANEVATDELETRDLTDLDWSSVPPVLPPIGSIARDCGNEDASCGLYFCIPQNDTLLEYWDRVEDRLFKIRHCMNIEGVARELPLYQPPIDPALLVLAAAKGIDIGSVLNDLSAPLPYHRFEYMLQKALELCAEVKSLGTTLLATLEKKDAEKLAMRRATDERLLLDEIRDTRDQQLKEADANIAALNGTIDALQPRKAFYAARVKESEENRRLSEETAYLEHLEKAQEWQEKSQVVDQIAGALGYMPNFNVAGPCSGTSWGSSNLIAALGMVSRDFSMMAARHSFHANRSSTLGQWHRRADDWRLQHELVIKEEEQLGLQFEAAELRKQIAQSELDNHDKQIANAAAVEEFLHDKFTNEELYGWMKGRIVGIYFQTYKLAYDLAKRAEKAYRYENGLSTSDFIRFGYWDSTREGLLAGEQLHHDLKRMETAHLTGRRREYELTKHISLLQVAPLALIELRATGRCHFDLPEALFDFDAPGHYFRRIKQVAVTIPCVLGPYNGVHCRLSLVKSRIRIKPGGSYAYEGLEDPAFTHRFGAVESIVTSSGQNDSGLFETNLRDERWLPFEGAGAIGTWELALPANPSDTDSVPAQFDYDSISDIVLHMRYTAREGGEPLRSEAAKTVKDQTSNLPRMRIFSVRSEFPTAWAQFKAATTDPALLVVPLRHEHFPFWTQYELQNKEAQFRVRVFAKPSENGTPAPALNHMALTEAYGDWLTGEWGGSWNNDDINLALPPDSLEGLLLVVDWEPASNQ